MLKLDIPSSVTSIDGSAFRDCSSLTDVIVEWDEPISVNQWSLVFMSCPQASATLHVPAGTADKYRQAETWKDFGNIVEYDPSGIHQLENGVHGVKDGKYLQNGRIVIKKSGREYTIEGK